GRGFAARRASSSSDRRWRESCGRTRDSQCAWISACSRPQENGARRLNAAAAQELLEERPDRAGGNALLELVDLQLDCFRVVIGRLLRGLLGLGRQLDATGFSWLLFHRGLRCW